MTPRPPRLAPGSAGKTLDYIRSGGFPWVAAEAAGVPIEQFMAWMRSGERPRAGRMYRQFVADVRQALAACRLLAEAQVFKSDPRFWLTHGPGRHEDALPGWAAPVRTIVVAEQAATDSHAELIAQVAGQLRETYADRPEIIDSVVNWLVEKAPELRKNTPAYRPSAIWGRSNCGPSD